MLKTSLSKGVSYRVSERKQVMPTKQPSSRIILKLHDCLQFSDGIFSTHPYWTTLCCTCIYCLFKSKREL